MLVEFYALFFFDATLECGISSYNLIKIKFNSKIFFYIILNINIYYLCIYLF